MTGKSAAAESIMDSLMGYDPAVVQQQLQAGEQAYQGRLNQAMGIAGGATLGAGALAALLRSVYLRRQREQDRKKLMGVKRPVLPLVMPKMAAGGAISEVLSPIVSGVTSATGAVASDALSGLGQFMSGRDADSWYNMPLAVPLVAGGALAGGIGGSRLADYLAKKRRKEELKAELLEEQQKFESMLRADRRTKASCAVEDMLDAIEQRCGPELEKKANIGLGALAGGGLTLAGIMSVLAAREGYKQRAKLTKSKALDQALREYRLLSHQLRPTPITLSLPAAEMEERDVALA